MVLPVKIIFGGFMKIFLDTAHIESIEKANASGLIDGITTNPSSLSKEGGDIVAQLRTICKIMAPKDVSIEVTELEPQALYQQAKTIAALASNVVVKIPCHPQFVSVIKKLAEEKVKLNITLVFSLTQAVCMAKLGVKYVSPFVGRLEDHGQNGIQLIEEIVQVFAMQGYQTQVLAASIRDIKQVEGVMLAGADIITLPVKVFDQLLEHELTKQGIELFESDWKKLGIKQFP